MRRHSVEARPALTNRYDTPAEVFAEVAVDEGINAAVGRTQPLRHGQHVR